MIPEIEWLTTLVGFMKEHQLLDLTYNGVSLTLAPSALIAKPVIPAPVIEDQDEAKPQNDKNNGKMPSDEELLFYSTPFYEETGSMSVLEIAQNPGILNTRPESLPNME